MKNQLFALAERLTPRLLSAGLVFVLAAYSTPAVVGVYSAGILAYTLVQSLSESAMRQILPDAVNERTFLHGYRRFAPLVASGILLAFVLVLTASTNAKLGLDALALLPLIVAPYANARSLAWVGRLQLAGKWHVLAQGQLLAAAIGFTVCFPIIALVPGCLGAAMFLPVTEAVNAIWARDRSRRIEGLRFEPVSRSTIARNFRFMASYSGLAWAQGQADRSLIGLLGGVANLGQFSIAASLARSIGDPLAASTANLLRVRLAEVSPVERPRIAALSEHVVSRAVLVAAVSALVATTLGWFVVGPILGPRWMETVHALPILAVSCIPSALNWSGSVLQLKLGKPRRALLVPIVGLAFAPGVALAALYDLQMAAWIVVLREYVVATTTFALAGSAAPWKSYSAALVIGVLASAALLALLH